LLTIVAVGQEQGDKLIVGGEEELKIECIPMGSTTWKREQVKRGIESDQCYYFDPAKMETAGSSEESKSRLAWKERLREWLRTEFR
jgi:hypothetical protein